MNSSSEILKSLAQFISIQSVSTDSSRFLEIEKAASFLKNKLASLGFSLKLIKKYRSPLLVIAVRKTPQASKTIAIYGHYDVQPEDPVSEWKTNPFKLTDRHGRLYGRGVADSKGHIIQNIVAIESLIRKKKLRNNIVFILEGEEKTDSCNFESYSKQTQDLLDKIDVFYVVDMGMHGKNRPQIFYSLRGLLYFELEVAIGKRDLHSGIYGNLVLNPVQVLTALFAKMKGEKTGKVKIPGFYHRVKRLSQRELDLLKKVKKTIEAEKAEAQAYQIHPVDKRHPFLSSKIYPSLDINGIYSGYTGQGSKTIIPHQAVVKFSCRLVEDQEPEEIKKIISRFIKNYLPERVRYKLKTLALASPFHVDIENYYLKKTATILKQVFGREPLFNRSGGSIKVAEILQRMFQKPVVITGFTLPDDNVHAPNENIDKEMFFKGIEALKKSIAEFSSKFDNSYHF